MGSKGSKHGHNNKGKWHIRAAREMPTVEEIRRVAAEGREDFLDHPPYNWLGTIQEWREKYADQFRDIDPQVIEDGYAEGIRAVSPPDGGSTEAGER